jgi:hypothetical protein
LIFAGEDPLVNGDYAVHFVQGMQEGEDSRYLKVGATCKHAFGYSLEGGETTRLFVVSSPSPSSPSSSSSCSPSSSSSPSSASSSSSSSSSSCSSQQAAVFPFSQGMLRTQTDGSIAITSMP